MWKLMLTSSCLKSLVFLLSWLVASPCDILFSQWSTSFLRRICPNKKCCFVLYFIFWLYYTIFPSTSRSWGSIYLSFCWQSCFWCNSRALLPVAMHGKVKAVDAFIQPVWFNNHYYYFTGGNKSVITEWKAISKRELNTTIHLDTRGAFTKLVRKNVPGSSLSLDTFCYINGLYQAIFCWMNS